MPLDDTEGLNLKRVWSETEMLMPFPITPSEGQRNTGRERAMRIVSCELLGATFLCYLIRFATTTVLLNPISASFPDLPARFAATLNKHGICGALYVADPPDGCSQLRDGATLNKSEQRIKFVLVIRGECSFEEKIRNVQNAGFQAAIVYDDKENEDLVYMMVNRRGLTVPAVFVSKKAGEILSKNAKGEDGECCIYPPSDGKAWTVLAISFFSLVLIISFLLIAFFAPRNWAQWRWKNGRLKTVDANLVETLPRLTFEASIQSHTGETCAICLEDYREGESLRLLPCKHVFHLSCVDSWLTNWGTSCPVCKLDILTKTTCSEPNGRGWLRTAPSG